MDKLRKVFIYILYLYVIALPLLPSKFKFKGIPLDGDSILALLILLYLLKILIDRESRTRFINGLRNFFKDYLNIFIFLWIAMMYVSVLYAKDKTLALSETIRFTTYAVLFYIIKYDITEKKVLDNILKLYIFVSMLIGTIGIIESFEGFGISSSSATRFINLIRVSSTLENANNLGVFFILIFFPLLVLFIKENNKLKKSMYFLFTLISVFNIIISGSRNAILALIIGILLLIIMYNYKIIYILLAGTGISLLVPQTFNIIKALGSKFQDPGRIKLWEIALYIIKDHPILGVGNGNYRTYYPMYTKYVKNIEYYARDNFHPHSIFLKAQSELGIFGLFSLVGMLISSVAKIIKFSSKVEDKFYKYFYKGFTASIIAFIFMNSIDNFFSAPKVIAFFWILLAAAESYQYNIKNGYLKY
ncbi:O-antigen ligase family protein [Candidatus Clostridium radicumherbarum]|uniref:O-antigen ligase family protein n=1 Tax=Candidatus Clostridium radicumherbarum TaxID=3381662 RepID=A0ABW8TYS4_9CLOT